MILLKLFQKKFVPEEMLRNLNGFNEEDDVILQPGKEIMLKMKVLRIGE